MHNKSKSGKKKRVVRRIVTWLIILVVLAGLGFYTVNRLKKQYTITYDSYTASVGSISNYLSFNGNVALIDSTTVSASSPATVRKLYVTAGDRVKKGDKLIRLSNGDSFTADFDGRINSVSVSEGDNVEGGTQLLQLADFSHMRVTFRVDEYDISDVAVGMACTVTATATEKVFPAVIGTIDYISQAGGNVAYYNATLDLEVNDGENLYPGMQVTVTVPQEEAENVVILKVDALSFDPMNNAFVYMRNGEGSLVRNDVEVGVSNGNYVEIKSGLKDGDTVYVEAKQTEESSKGLLAGLFGGVRMNNRQRRGNDSGSNYPNTGGYGGGNMPAPNGNPGSMGGVR